MLNSHAGSQVHSSEGQDNVFETQVRFFRTGVIVALGVFAGTVLGGVCGLFVYANSRTPNQHDGVFVVIQALGIILGVAMGYLAAKSAEAQEQLIDASQRAGTLLLRRYRPKPGTAGHSNVGQRTIGASPTTEGEDFLRSILGTKP